MKKGKTRKKVFVWLVAAMLCLAAFFVVPLSALAAVEGSSAEDAKDEDASAEGEDASSEKIVRVGWFESIFNRTDQFGRRNGYGYEYQRKIAAYTGWDYEYVEGSWSELLEKLENGEIDLLADVSYMEERTENMLYAALPMGTEAYYMFVLPDNPEIRADDVSSLTGKKIGVDKGSVQIGMYRKWSDMYGVSADLIEITGTQEDALGMLQSGELDAFLTLDSFGEPETVKPLWKVGSADIYFAVNKERPDLLKELDLAMSRIQDENMNYNQQLSEKYLANAGTNHYLSTEELSWLENHGPIRVGYQDSYLAFCAKDEKTGELTGALKDYLDYAKTGLENADLEFETVCYPTAAAALEAVKNGEVDCMFPANLTDYDGEGLDIVMTPALMTTEMDAVVRASAQKEFLKKEDVTVAVNEGNTNYEMFLEEHYPGWKIAYFKDTPAGLEAVATGDVDCVIISNYRFSNISKKCDKLHLTTVYTGVDMDYSFAVKEGEGELYSILSKVTHVVPKAVTSAALTYYSTEDVKTGFMDIIMDNLIVILLVVITTVLIIIALLIGRVRAEKKAFKEHSRVKELDKKAYMDALTNVRNKGAFTEYIQEMEKRMAETGERAFAIGILDCDNLKKINDVYGHDKGDAYLKGASQLICHVFRHSPVFRIGGDEFAVILEDQDYRNMEGLIKSFYRRKKENNEMAENEWDEVNISLGIATYDVDMDESLEDTIRRADKIMYENKRVWKKAHGIDR